VSRAAEMSLTSSLAVLTFVSCAAGVAWLATRRASRWPRAGVERAEQLGADRKSEALARLLVDNHLRLDEAIEAQLKVVLLDTESSALALTVQLRELSDATTGLSGQLGNSGKLARDLEAELRLGVAAIVHVADFVQALPEALREDAVVRSLQALQVTCQDIGRSFGALLDMAARHGADVARGSSEMLGQLQYQDVARQRIERASFAVARRNDVLRELPRGMADPNGALAELPAKMRTVLEEYLADEARHFASSDDASSLPKCELF
jgi:methyl-accepting chemotaxis protein